jgi:hypothetical protein
VVWSLPADAEMDAVRGDMPPAAAAGGRIAGAVARRLLGEASGFSLRAVDTRTPLVPGVLENPTLPAGSPGVRETSVRLHPWLPSIPALGGS